MSFTETAKKIVCAIIAVALSITVAAVEGLLPHRPDWLERVEKLAVTLRNMSKGSAGREAAGTAGEGEESGSEETGGDEEIDVSRLLLAYNRLWEFVHDIRADGLALDEPFCERIEREWSVTTLLTYLRNADKSLQEHAGKALDEAGTALAAPQSTD